jgi:hypothetical protein
MPIASRFTKTRRPLPRKPDRTGRALQLRSELDLDYANPSAAHRGDCQRIGNRRDTHEPAAPVRRRRTAVYPRSFSTQRAVHTWPASLDQTHQTLKSRAARYGRALRKSWPSFTPCRGTSDRQIKDGSHAQRTRRSRHQELDARSAMRSAPTVSDLLERGRSFEISHHIEM